MRKGRFTTEQIVGVLHERKAGGKINELFRRHRITDTTFHRRKKKYSGMQVSGQNA
jgi:putative transposase